VSASAAEHDVATASPVPAGSTLRFAPGSSVTFRDRVVVAVLSFATAGDLHRLLVVFHQPRDGRPRPRHGQVPINGWIGLLLALVLSPALHGYMQGGLNSAWSAAHEGTWQLLS
jgi:hypothetical protein